jgi:flagellar hook-basal body complex protein FliE
MSVGPLGPLSVLSSVSPKASTGQAASTGGENFSQFLSNAVNQANSVSHQADAAASTYAAGGPVSLDQVMIAEQKASLALDLVVQVRDRAVSAYQTLMNMQV